MVSDGFETVLASRSIELRTVKRYYILAVRVYQCHYRERGHYLAWSDTACVTTGGARRTRRAHDGRPYISLVVRHGVGR